MRGGVLAILSAVLLLGACTPPATPPKGPVELNAAEKARIEQAQALMLGRDAADPAAIERNRSACGALGGEYGRDGRLGAFHCTLTYSDAGKACWDEADCKGNCRAAPEPVKVGEAPGTCQRTTSPFGCYGTVKNGKVEGTICVD